MKSILKVLAVGLFLMEVSQVRGQGDEDSSACRSVQLVAQSAVDNGGPYKNHGQLVSTAAKVVDAAVEGGLITESCAACIMDQFARGIPTSEQVPCGNPGCVSPLRGPDDKFNCTGDVVGGVAISDQGGGAIQVQVTFVCGKPNYEATVWWACTLFPGGCHNDLCNDTSPLPPYLPIGEIKTNEAGQGSTTINLGAGNPFPGHFMHLDTFDAHNVCFTATPLCFLP